MKIVALVFLAIGVVLFLRANRSSERAAAPEALPDSASAQQLAQWKAVVDEHALPAQRLQLTGQPVTSPIASKIGGQPYWTKERTYPVSAAGTPLHFLAQINFAELDDRTGAYPDAGVLQFFIGSDDLYGSNFEKPQPDSAAGRDYAVVFHDRPDAARHVDAPAPSSTEAQMLPFRGQTGVRFENIMNPVSPLDYRFEKLLPGVLAEHDEIAESLYDYAINAPSHQMGGYAVFTQSDPREGSAADEDWQLLFQIDTDSVNDFEIMWGDVGIANFFIRSQDLAKRDFSQVWYNWDCS